MPRKISDTNNNFSLVCFFIKLLMMEITLHPLGCLETSQVCTPFVTVVTLFYPPPRRQLMSMTIRPAGMPPAPQLAQAAPVITQGPPSIDDVPRPAAPTAGETAEDLLGAPDAGVTAQPDNDGGVTFVLPGYEHLNGRINLNFATNGAMGLGGHLSFPDMNPDDHAVNQFYGELDLLVHSTGEEGVAFLQSLGKMGELAADANITLKELLVGYREMEVRQDGTQPSWYAELSVGQRGELATFSHQFADIFARFPDGAEQKLLSLAQGTDTSIENAPWTAELTAGYTNSIPLGDDFAHGNAELNIGAQVSLLQALSGASPELVAGLAAELRVPLDVMEQTVAYAKVMTAVTTADRFAGQADGANVGVQGTVGLSHSFNDHLATYLELQAGNLQGMDRANGGFNWDLGGDPSTGISINGNVSQPFDGSTTGNLGAGYSF
jgi:hypothetical protein